MKLKELIFTAMNIPDEVGKILSNTEEKYTNGMKDNELKAYRLGIQNALSCLNGLLNMDEQVVVHNSELDIITECDIDEFIKLCEEKEKCNYD